MTRPGKFGDLAQKRGSYGTRMQWCVFRCCCQKAARLH